MTTGLRLGIGILAVVGLLALLAPAVSPSAPSAQHLTHPFAPPMLPRIRLANGEGWRPHVARLTLTDKLQLTYAHGPPLPLDWFAEGTLVRSADARHPLLWLGSDMLGRDVWTRLVYGARYSLGLAALAVVGATAIGAGVGLLAGWRGGVVDTVLMRLTDLFIVLPALYVVLLFRASFPLVMEPSALFLLMAGVLALAGWPSVARGVRSIVAVEREREYVLAARVMGASGWRIVTRHLLPSTLPFLGTQAVLLLPAFIAAEATLSFIGLGFAEPTPSWGTLLRDTFSVRVLRDAPWLLAPAVAIALVTVAANLVREGRR